MTYDLNITFDDNLLRNVVPRQGTEIVAMAGVPFGTKLIEKCSSPTGDGNFLRVVPLI